MPVCGKNHSYEKHFPKFGKLTSQEAVSKQILSRGSNAIIGLPDGCGQSLGWTSGGNSDQLLVLTTLLGRLPTVLAHVFNITGGLDDSVDTEGRNFLMRFRKSEQIMFRICQQTAAPAHQIGNRICFNLFAPDI
jgi:hypothetical protein